MRQSQDRDTIVPCWDDPNEQFPVFDGEGRVANPSHGAPSQGRVVLYPSTAAKIRAAIEAAGMSQLAVADELGVQASAVNGWCKGRHIPNSPKQYRLAKLLRVSIDTLVDQDEIVRVDEDFQRTRGAAVRAAHQAKRDAKRKAAQRKIRS